MLSEESLRCCSRQAPWWQGRHGGPGHCRGRCHVIKGTCLSKHVRGAAIELQAAVRPAVHTISFTSGRKPSRCVKRRHCKVFMLWKHLCRYTSRPLLHVYAVGGGAGWWRLRRPTMTSFYRSRHMAKNEFSHKPIVFFDNVHVIVRLKPLEPKYITVKVVRQTHTGDMSIHLLV